MMLIKYCFVLIFLTSFAVSQNDTDCEEPGPIEPAPTEDEIEFENPEEQDQIFDDSLLNETWRPDLPPTEEEVTDLLENGTFADEILEAVNETVVGRGKRSTSLIVVNLYVYYFTHSDWYINYYRKCPSHYNGCGVTRALRHPCFYHYHGGRIEWCCTFYPNVYIYNCNCRSCVRQCPYGYFVQGKCYRRYRYQRMYAVCYRGGWWSYLRLFYRYVPSSCYCRAWC